MRLQSFERKSRSADPSEKICPNLGRTASSGVGEAGYDFLWFGFLAPPRAKPHCRFINEHCYPPEPRSEQFLQYPLWSVCCLSSRNLLSLS